MRERGHAILGVPRMGTRGEARPGQARQPSVLDAKVKDSQVLATPRIVTQVLWGQAFLGFLLKFRQWGRAWHKVHTGVQAAI